MLKKLFAVTALLAALFAAPNALAQSQPVPPFYYSFVPTAGQWNSFFAAKMDYLGGPANAIPYYTGSGTTYGTVSGDCTEIAMSFTCKTLNGVTPGNLFPLNAGTGLSIAGGVLNVTGAPPTGAAGGVLSGTYPNPGFASATGTGAVVLAISPTLTTPNLGTPSAVNLTNGTALPIGSGVSGLGTGVATALGVAVGSVGAPVVNGGVLGTPSSGVATNLTGLPLTTGVTGTLPFGSGGTGQTSYTDGQLLIGDSSTGGLDKNTLAAGSGITIINGHGTITIASLTQVIPKWTITGFIPTAISGTNTTAAVTISAGQAVDSTDTSYITDASTTSWAVSNGNAINGYAGGSTLPNSSTINFFMCSGGSGTGSYASTSLTPTCPAGYTTVQRRLFSLVTNSSGALLSGSAVEVAGGGVLFTYNAFVIDVNAVTASSTAVTQALTVPTGIIVAAHEAIAFAATSTLASNTLLLLSPLSISDQAPAVGIAQASIINTSGNSSTQSASELFIATNTSAQIRWRTNVSANAAVYITTMGWRDDRRN